LIIVGYVPNLFAVPLLVIAGNWEFAVVLIVAEPRPDRRRCRTVIALPTNG
jgi:hypothetical protein